jgi:5'-deoxynucleotidase YfbR-like HD superfamily hydrolase
MIRRSQYLAGAVRRWHTHHAMQQTNADHAWGVALIIMLFYEEQEMAEPGNLPTFKTEPSSALMQAAILHDAGEYITGDMPTTSKSRSPNLKAAMVDAEESALSEMGLRMPRLTEREQLWLKFADSLEAWLFVRNRGNLSEVELADYFPAVGEKARECARELGLDMSKVFGGFAR